MKIYDSFLFFNELDILEIRLNTLYDVVDHFILVESSVTHQGVSKPFIFDENKERFAKFLDKIIHIKVTDTPDDFSIVPAEFEDSPDGRLIDLHNHIMAEYFFKESARREVCLIAVTKILY